MQTLYIAYKRHEKYRWKSDEKTDSWRRMTTERRVELIQIFPYIMKNEAKIKIIIMILSKSYYLWIVTIHVSGYLKYSADNSEFYFRSKPTSV